MEIKNLWSGTPVSKEDKIELKIQPGPEIWRIQVSAPYYGDPPPSLPPGPTWGLWEHEVVEWFIAGPGTEYLEIELGPHGHHLALRLSDIREISERELPMQYKVTRARGRWTGEASFPVEWLPAGPWRVNAYGIHGVGENRVYLATYPTPGSSPDFHQLNAFQPLSELS